MTAHETLVSALRELHLQAGLPSARSIANATKVASHTTVNDMLSGRQVSSWPLTAAVVTHLGGDEADFLHLWVEEKRRPPLLRRASNEPFPRQVHALHRALHRMLDEMHAVVPCSSPTRTERPRGHLRT